MKADAFFMIDLRSLGVDVSVGMIVTIPHTAMPIPRFGCVPSGVAVQGSKQYRDVDVFLAAWRQQVLLLGSDGLRRKP